MKLNWLQQTFEDIGLTPDQARKAVADLAKARGGEKVRIPRVRDLEDRDYEAYRLHVELGLAVALVAERLGCTERTVFNRVARHLGTIQKIA